MTGTLWCFIIAVGVLACLKLHGWYLCWAQRRFLNSAEYRKWYPLMQQVNESSRLKHTLH